MDASKATKAAMDANKATKAALDVKEAAADVKYDLKASEDVKKSSRQPQAWQTPLAGHMLDMDHMVDMVPWATMGKKVY